jgi:hypothetical protein
VEFVDEDSFVLSGQGPDHIPLPDDIAGNPELAQVVRSAIAQRQQAIAEESGAKMVDVYKRMNTQLMQMERMMMDAARKLADCATRDELVAIANELSGAIETDDTAIGAVPCRCLACGRPKAMSRLTKIDGYLNRVLNCPPLASSSRHAPGATISVYQGQSNKPPATPIRRPPRLSPRHKL